MTRQPLSALRTFADEQLDRVCLPVGGIGTGTIGFGGRADLRDFEIGNRPAKGFRPGIAFFALRFETEAGPVVRLLEGPLSAREYEGAMGATAAHHGLPRYPHATFASSYPFGEVQLSGEGLPKVTVEAFNPFIPGMLEESSIPVMVLRYRVAAPAGLVSGVSVVGSFSNFVGSNGTEDVVGGNSNRAERSDRIAGVRLSANGLAPDLESAGEFCLSAVLGDAQTASTRTAWSDAPWGNSLLDFWDDISADGALDERKGSAARPVASVAVSDESGADEVTFTFLLTWNFPNRRAWRTGVYAIDLGEYDEVNVGNHYSGHHPDPWLTALDVRDRLPQLEARTRAISEAIVSSAVPAPLVEAAMANLSTLRSPTLFRIADGRFFGWEGVMDRVGACFGTCTHVWAYEFATSALFAEIGWSFRETQFVRSLDERGMMVFRAGMTPGTELEWGLAAADGQMACLVHLFYDWRLGGDTDRMLALWPAARSALAFAWVPGGWDADQDGVMEGCQHNTMDVDYYGPNPQMQSWYLAALLAGEQLATAAGDAEFAERCRDLFRRGSEWTDANLFTGQYYEQHVVPIADASTIAPGIRASWDHSVDSANPQLQLGEGVLIDQLVGQYAARLAGLGDVLDPAHVATTLDHVYASNHRADLSDHFNHMRSYALGDESGVLMCTYAEGERPEQPFPYFNEIMTGFEHTLAAGHVQSGNRGTAVAIVSATRSRYDGRRRNPFDEAECGHHYARALASWSTFSAWAGYDWDARSGVFTFDADIASTFWSTGSACGTWTAATGSLSVLEGSLTITAVEHGGRRMSVDQQLGAGDTYQVR